MHPDVTFSCLHDANANLSHWENAILNRVSIVLS